MGENRKGHHKRIYTNSRRVIMKGFIKRGNLVLMGVVLFWVLCTAGCIEMTMKTKIFPDGRCTESIQLSTNAMFAEGIKTELEKKNLAREGYKVETTTQGDIVHVNLTRDYKSVQDMTTQKRLDPTSGMKDEGKSEERKPQDELKVEDLFFIKTMTFKETMPGAGKKEKKDLQGKDKQMDEMQRKFAQSIFSFKRLIEMPGPIVSSNADSVDKATNTATWNVPFDKMDDGVTFEVKSQVVNYPAIIICASLLLVALIAVLAAVLRKKRNPDMASQ
jgi:hypothetical protein